jgi:hypothetical protein
MDDGPWYGSQSTNGMAVDKRGRLYFADYQTVYTLEGSAPSAYLTIGEIVSQAGLYASDTINDLDIAPDDTVYLLVSGSLIHSRAAHQATLFYKHSSTLGSAHLGVVAADQLVHVDRDGFWVVSNGAEKLVYDSARMQGSRGCATEDLAVARSGRFLYQPGCLGSPILHGDVNGAGVTTLYEIDRIKPSEIHADAFNCVTRDPLGGFYLVVGATGGPRLYHVTEDASGSNEPTEVSTTPSLAEAQRLANIPLAFRYCSIAAGHDGTIFLQTFQQLWKIAP